MQLSTIFPVYRGGQFYWWRKPAKTTDLHEVADKLHHIKLNLVHLVMSGTKQLKVQDIQISTYYEKIILKFVVLSNAQAKPGTIFPVIRKITRYFIHIDTINR